MILADHVKANELELRELLPFAGREHAKELADYLLPACLNLPELQPSRAFSGNYSDLIVQWIQGTPMSELISEFMIDDELNFSIFVDDFFRYKLPWGLAGYNRIALKLLEIDEAKLSSFSRYLPSMVKFGVPNPTACWAMAIGIPFRDIAIKIAAAFDLEFGNTKSWEMLFESDADVFFAKQRNFLEWLTALDSERLRHEFQLRPPFLEDVRRAIRTKGRNPLFPDFKDLITFLPTSVSITGTNYENRGAAASQLRLKDPVRLRRDYNNPVDRNAILAETPYGAIGFIPANVAQLLAPELDAGVELNAEVDGLLPGDVPEVSILLKTLF